MKRRLSKGAPRLATDIHDLSSDLQTFVASTGIDSGLAILFVPGSTAALTTIEFESGAVNDLKRTIEKLAPEAAEYEHDMRWGDGNGFSHVRSALMGPSLVVPVSQASSGNRHLAAGHTL